MGREWGGDGKGKFSLQATRDQGWTGSYHDKEGFQVSKREVGLEKEEASWQGKQNKGLRHNCAIKCAINCVYVYNNCLTVECS
jgi:hypothetical protein